MTRTQELTIEQIKMTLAEHGYIGNLWHTDDVRQERPDLTEEQAWEVLEACEDSHDANIGINWEVIRIHAADLYPESEQVLKPRYEVQTEMLSGWENCWTTDAGEQNPNGTPVTYGTREEAEQAIRDHITDCINAVEGGDMMDSPDPISLRVVEVAS
jgi:hypothetical protein